jgi:hypothetical protein
MAFDRDIDVCLYRDEWDLCKNHQPLVLVGRGFGTLVLDDLFLKATEEVLTSSTEAGAFVRNVRGVTFYGDGREALKSCKIQKYFESMSGHIKSDEWTLGDEATFAGIEATFAGDEENLGLGRPVYITQGTSLIDPTIYEIVFRGPRDVCNTALAPIRKALMANMSLIFSFLHGLQHLRGSTCG